MGQKNSKGVSALRVLQNASCREHYEFLQNSSRLIARLGKSAVRLAVGTTRNEQLHHEFKSWMRNIRMSHVTRIQISIRVFVIAKILSHSSACYSPTLVQKTQLRLINSIAGEIRHMVFFKEPLHPVPESIRSGLADIISPVVLLDPSVSKERSNKRKLEKAMWSKEKKIARVKVLNKTNIFRLPRAGNRTQTWGSNK